YLQQAVAMDTHNVVARANLAEALVGLGRLDEGIAELRRAAAEEPFAAEPRIGLVLAYRRAGNTKEMRKQLTILRQLHPAAARAPCRSHGAIRSSRQSRRRCWRWPGSNSARRPSSSWRRRSWPRWWRSRSSICVIRSSRTRSRFRAFWQASLPTWRPATCPGQTSRSE